MSERRRAGYDVPTGNATWAEQCLLRAEAAATEAERLAFVKGIDGDTEEPRRRQKAAQVEASMQARCATLLATLAVEGCINFYGTRRLGEARFLERYERRSPPTRKLRTVLVACGVTPPTRTSELCLVTRALFDARNDLAHPKTIERSPGHWVAWPLSKYLEPARLATANMRRFFELFEAHDPKARAEIRTCRDVSEAEMSVDFVFRDAT